LQALYKKEATGRQRVEQAMMHSFQRLNRIALAL